MTYSEKETELKKLLGVIGDELPNDFLEEQVEDFKQNEAIEIIDDGRESMVDYLLEKARKKAEEDKPVTIVFIG